MIKPIIFTLVQAKLKNEITGRKKKEAIELPIIMLCRSCRNIPERTGNYICYHLGNEAIKIDDERITNTSLEIKPTTTNEFLSTANSLI